MNPGAVSDGTGAPSSSTVEQWGADPQDADLVVLAVHGRDQDPSFLREVSARIGIDRLSWVAPCAPGRSWYPNRFLDDRAANEPALGEALATVQGHLDRLTVAGISTERVVLLGFSQGACLLSDHLLCRPVRHAAVALLTGGFIGPAGYAPRLAGSLTGTPVLVSSSTVDEWVPAERVRETAALLRAAGAQVSLRLDDDPIHHVNDATVAAAAELITAALPTR